MNSKGNLAIVLAIIISILVIGSGIFYYFNISKITPKSTEMTITRPSATPTAIIPEDWKTYEDENFSFKYPSNLVTQNQSWGVFFWNPDNLQESMNLRKQKVPFPELIEGEAKPYPEINNGKELEISLLTPNQSVVTTKSTFDIVEDRTDEFNYSEKTLKNYWVACGNDCGYEVARFQIKDNYYQIIINVPDGKPYLLSQILSTLKINNQNQVDISNWKTYTGKDFSFQYPPDATAESIRETSEIVPKPDILIRVTPPFQPPWDEYYNLLISVEKNPESLSSRELIDEYIKTIEVHPTTEGTINKIKKSIKEYKNGDVNGLMVNTGFEYDWLEVYQVRDGKTYNFQITGDQGGLNDYVIEMFDKILATFKFIK
jgi:hypothetical protein